MPKSQWHYEDACKPWMFYMLTAHGVTVTGVTLQPLNVTQVPGLFLCMSAC